MTKLNRIDLLTLALELRLAARTGATALKSQDTRLTPDLLMAAAVALEAAARIAPVPSETVIHMPRINRG